MVHAHHFGKIKVHRQGEREREREREREMCVLFEFRHFVFNPELVYVFQSFVYSLAKDSDRRDVLE